MTRSKLYAFGLLLALVLLGHGLILSWLSERTQQMKPLIPMADPMLTRIIELARPALPVQRPNSRSVGPVVKSAVAVLPPAAGVTLAGMPGDPVGPDLVESATVALEQSEPAAPVVEARSAFVADDVPAFDSWPADTRVSYALKGFYRGALYGSANVQWQREQSRYQVRLDLNLALLLRYSMISQGEVGAESLSPGVYEERFPWELRRMVFEAGSVRFDNGVQLPQPPAVQDTVSQFVELSHRFSSGREVLKVGGEVMVWLARPQGLALWTYDVVEEEILQTSELGAVPAYHLRPRPITNPTGVISAELWFAPSLQYLPVRVRIALGADNFVDLLVERVEQGAAPVAVSGNWRDGP